MWTEQPFEEKMREKLTNMFGKDPGLKYFSQYTEARNYLCDHIYPEIKGIEASLTDHSQRHIQNVMKNVDHILDDDYNKLDGINIYCLGIIILFHDVGIIHGRDDHNKNIADVYNKVRNRRAEFNQERNIIIRAAEAHTGFDKDGTLDTLKNVPEIDHLQGYKIKLQELAAILRLADECAEGPQRTSDYLLKTNIWDEKSQVHHDYAAMTEVFIDKGSERIVLTYNIDISKENLNELWLKNILTFVFKRIIKLDIERAYCKHYTQILFKFKKTEASLLFSVNGIPTNCDVPSIILTDKYPIPKKEEDLSLSEIESLKNEFQIDAIIEKILAKNQVKDEPANAQ